MSIAEIAFVLGRVLLGGYFLRSAWHHFKHSPRLVGYATSKGVVSPTVAVVGSGVLLLLGGLGILLGVYVNWAIACLVGFLIPVTGMMHAFWKIQDPMQQMSELINFYKNLALLGAILMLLSVPQPWIWSLLP